MERKYQIFISSTYTDLVEERKKVSDTILSMYQFPVGMEMFSSADEEQWEVIKDTIDSSDYYVLIVGHKYGSVVENGEDAGISYTEKEYMYAKSRGIPILAFIISDSVPVLPCNMEDDMKNKERLNLFKKDISTGRVVEWWKNKDELASSVMNSLNKQINKGKRLGWVRASGFSIEKTQNELVEMSKKIRRLEKENAELREHIEVRVPELKIEVNECDNLEIPFYEENLTFVDVIFAPLSIDDIPKSMISTITRNQIEEYNNTLPSKDEVDEYKNKLQIYKRAQNQQYKLDLKIANDGKLKARDVRVEIEFPDEIKVYKKKKIRDMREPKQPSKGINPIEKCYKKENNLNKAILTNMIFQEDINTKLFDLDEIKQANYENKHFYNDDNSISLILNDLLNSYTWSVCDKYCLVPEKKGVFDIKCSLMCEEFSEVKMQIIKVSVI